MSDLDFGPGTIRQFRGRMARGGDTVVPPEYAISESNVEFTELGVKTRTGFSYFIGAQGNWNGVAVRVYEYKKRNEASRRLILDNQNQIWDSSTSFTTPILTVTGMTDFSAETMYDRVYISPHDGDRGLSNEHIYVYDGTGTARIAGGNGPTGFALSVSPGTAAGNVTPNVHLFSVAFETVSGHITKFSTTHGEYAEYLATVDKTVKISNIPTGGSFVVARWIVCTKAYSGRGPHQDPNAAQWFFLKKIEDNTTTMVDNIDFFDTSLNDSADRLLNQLGEIPAGSCITAFGSRLVIGGERANDATLRISDAGYPEAFSGLSGFSNFLPGDSGGAVRFLLSYRKMLFGFKDYRTLVTQDNGSSPNTWEVNSVDDGFGTSVHGSAGVLDSKGQSLDCVLVCARNGVMPFTGTYGASNALTYMIEDLWNRINPLYFHKIQIAVDPVKRIFYIAVPLDAATSVNTLLMCDFTEGLTFDKVKWSTWTMPFTPDTLWVEVDYSTNQTVLRLGTKTIVPGTGLGRGIQKKDPVANTDGGTSILSHYQCGYVTADSSGGVSQFQVLRVCGSGNGLLNLTLYPFDYSEPSFPPGPGQPTMTLPPFSLTSTPWEYNRSIGFFNSPRASIRFSASGYGYNFNINAVRLACSPLWSESWQS